MHRLFFLSAALIWMGPWIGKNYLPDIFNNPLLQYGSAVILSVIIGIGLNIGMTAIYRNNIKYTLDKICILGLPAILLLNLSSYSIMTPILLGIQMKISDDEINKECINRAIDLAYRDENFNKRNNEARKLYITHGIKLIFRDNQGNYNELNPTPEDEEKRSLFIETENNSVKMKEMTQGMLDQFLILSVINIAITATSFIVSLFINTGKIKNSTQQVDSAEAATNG